jgi:hypothetical protein
MNFSTPLPWTEVLAELDSKGLLPSHLSSRELREEYGTDILHRSIFSARTTKAQVLQGYREQVAELLNGGTNIATARLKIQELLDGLGYDAERGGFPDTPGEPASYGSLQDLRSNQRVDLVLRTNMQQVAGAAETERANSDDALYWFPAWELVRVASVLTPRGMKRTRDGDLVEDPGQDWPSRWEKAGGKFYDGRMIARKDDPIWEKIGSTALFDDALDTSFPPWAFNSGKGRQEVARRECLALGLLGEADKVSPVTVRMNEGLAASVKGVAPDLIRAAQKDLRTKLDGYKLKLEAMGFDVNTGRYRR